MEVIKTFWTNNYSLRYTEKVLIIENWLGRKGLWFICSNKTEEEACVTVENSFKTFSERFKPQHSETIVSLQYCKLSTM